jgi:hypothetical protein
MLKLRFAWEISMPLMNGKPEWPREVHEIS